MTPTTGCNSVFSKTEFIPVDSEHFSIWSLLKGPTSEVEKIYITASGGPFINTPIQELKHVTVEEALNHPNWKMGSKVTIDSATLVNKCLELIEAKYLFDMNEKYFELVVHPQSIIHSIVTFIDGSSICQMSAPDMRVPIAYALGYPNRITSGVDGVSLDKLPRLEFFKPDLKKFRCLDISYK